ncbi:GtrA family protein [Pseudomonas abietaniphila]|uniref:GtrA-like protein n=1 Tax=Pseudomonas abietaniphila TaxID=89065 RepID=A0A1G8BRQ4_9PSED|nr:GtrA family protein [Pseudomonas abietaniphila]SDH35809.1 GtrA-like protein [Pseudomonas abietaniphila]
MKKLSLTTPAMLQLYKYITISGLSYAWVLSAMYFFVQIAHFPKQVSFVTTYALAYIFEYIVNLKYLYQKNHSIKTLVKFILQIAFFIAIGSIIFKGYCAMEIHYLISTLLTAGTLLPIRFIIQKFVVFR